MRECLADLWNEVPMKLETDFYLKVTLNVLRHDIWDHEISYLRSFLNLLYHGEAYKEKNAQILDNLFVAKNTLR